MNDFTETSEPNYASMEWFDERHFAEDVGLLFEAFGNNRMAGRVWGLLAIAEEDALSASDLGERLQASSGSISTATRLLIGLGMLERVRRPGDRKAYFQIRSGAMSQLVAHRQMLMQQAERLAQRGLEEFGDRPLARRRLEEWQHLYAFFVRETPPLIEKYQEERRRRLSGTE
jgi:DNA-binding MarR family transcriptional regulator